MAFESLARNRSVLMGERRTALSFAHVVQFLVENKYADTSKVILVLDNLNTHGVHSCMRRLSLRRQNGLRIISSGISRPVTVRG